MYVLVSALAGLSLAVVSVLGLVQVRNTTPDPVDEPLVVYGDR